MMYDPILRHMREVEMYRSQRLVLPLRVYSIMYEDSFEWRSYLGRMRKERDSFDTLVQQKAHLVIQEDDTGARTQSKHEPRVGDKTLESTTQSSRKAGGREVEAPEQRIIVDIREFRSALPGVLYGSGFTIEPVTLEVGDYVISDDICIERKSVSDLFGSLASGRLYKQLQAMCRHYKHAAVLIEFSADQSFALQLHSSSYDNLSASSISTKLSLVVLHFPTVRFLWSRGASASAKMFERLKQQRAQPDIAKAATIGSEADEAAIVPEHIQTARDMLLRLPGVNDNNRRSILKNGKTLAEILTMSKPDLGKAMQSTSCAAKLFEFVNMNMSQFGSKVTAPVQTKTKRGSKRKR